MGLRDHVICDSDLHVMEPPDLWERYIDPAYAHAAPRGLSEITRDMRVRVKNHVMLRMGATRPLRVEGRKTGGRRSTTPSTRRPRPGAGTPSRRSTPWTPRGSTWRCCSPHAGCSCSASTRPSRSAPTAWSPSSRRAIARAYNDWLKDFCDHAPRPHVRGGHGGGARRRRRGRRGAALRGGARLQGDLPAAGRGEPPAVAPPGLRPAVGRDPAPRRAAGVPRRRPDLPDARLRARGAGQADAVAHLQPAAGDPVRDGVPVRRRRARALPRI